MKKYNIHKWNIADTITTMRMVATLFLLFLSMKSVWFFIIYTFAGLTDVLDGWIARKSGIRHYHKKSGLQCRESY